MTYCSGGSRIFCWGVPTCWGAPTSNTYAFRWKHMRKRKNWILLGGARRGRPLDPPMDMLLFQISIHFQMFACNSRKSPCESSVSVAFNKDWMVMCEQDSYWKAEQGNKARRWGGIDTRDGPLHCPGSHQFPRLDMPLATETGPKVYSCLIHMLLSLNVFDHRSKTFYTLESFSSWSRLDGYETSLFGHTHENSPQCTSSRNWIFSHQHR